MAEEQQGATQKAMVLVAQARTRFVALPAKRRTSLLAGLAVLFALALGSIWYAGRPDWRVLFSGLETRDMQQVAQQLGAAGIAFQTTPDGIEVPADALDKARMEVAAKGMPQTGRLGFELFDKPNWVGSEFDERVNYQRALEGELEHTIGSLGAVRSARVHLVLPQQGLFAADQKTAKASVLLQLKHASLDSEQGDSIRNLVAGAVENLTADQVTLVDAAGRVNLQNKGASAREAEIEIAMEAKLLAMLEPLAGAGNVRATVNVSFEQGSEERTDEIYDPAQAATLSHQQTEQTSGGARTAQGVPGTASNAPAAASEGAVQGSAQAAFPGTPPLLAKSQLPVYPQAGGAGPQRHSEESSTFAVTRHTVHVEQAPGRVRRVAAAIVVNDRQTMEGVGKAEHAVWKPRSAEEMHRLESLAQAAVGFEERRGDQVVLENAGFSSNVPAAPVSGGAQILEQARNVLQQPGLIKTAMLGVLGLLTIWLVFRPVAKQLVATLQAPVLLESTQTTSTLLTAETRSDEAGPAGAERAALSEPVSPQSRPEPMRRSFVAGNEVFEQVAEHIRREPAHSTRLLEAWIGAEEKA